MSRNDFCSNYLAHWGFKKGEQKKNHKYIARVELPNGEYRYFYTLAEYAAYMKAQAKEMWDNKEELIGKKVDEGVAAVEKAYNDLDNKNKYLTDDYNYDKKIAQVQNTKEWQDIVKRNDPEYTKIDRETGQKTYDIDSYLAKKKHPVLDIVDDAVEGRRTTINKLDKDALVAGAADYAKTYVTMAAIGTKFLLEKFKFSQGSYKEEKQQAYNYVKDNKSKIAETAVKAESYLTDENTKKLIDEGEKYVAKTIKENGDNPIVKDVTSLKDSVSKEDYEQIKKEYEEMQKELEKYKRVKV